MFAYLHGFFLFIYIIYILSCPVYHLIEYAWRHNSCECVFALFLWLKEIVVCCTQSVGCSLAKHFCSGYFQYMAICAFCTCPWFALQLLFHFVHCLFHSIFCLSCNDCLLLILFVPQQLFYFVYCPPCNHCFFLPSVCHTTTCTVSFCHHLSYNFNYCFILSSVCHATTCRAYCFILSPFVLQLEFIVSFYPLFVMQLLFPFVHCLLPPWQRRLCFW